LQNPKKSKVEIPLRERAAGFVSRREHSRLELARKLGRYTQDEAEIGQLLDDFERRGWLSEARVVTHTVDVRRSKFGVQRIRQELRQKGVTDAAIAAALPGVRAGDLEAARAVWRKRFGVPPASAAERGKQVRFLQGRGFDLDTILKVIENADDE
jgi:regulatory protein